MTLDERITKLEKLLVVNEEEKFLIDLIEYGESYQSDYDVCDCVTTIKKIDNNVEICIDPHSQRGIEFTLNLKDAKKIASRLLGVIEKFEGE